MILYNSLEYRYQYSDLYSNTNLYITDLIYLSDCFNNLAIHDLEAVINENINRIQSYQENCIKKELKTKYTQANDDDEESVQYQMQLREQLKKSLKTGD